MRDESNSSGQFALEFLEDALALAEHPKAKFHIRQAMQYLEVEEHESD